MKLIALVIKQYDELFKEQIFNFSDEYKVDFNFETNELKIDKNPDYIENFYGRSVNNISLISGINGRGKSSILNMLVHYDVFQNKEAFIEDKIYCLVLKSETELYFEYVYNFFDSSKCSLYFDGELMTGFSTFMEGKNKGSIKSFIYNLESRDSRKNPNISSIILGFLQSRFKEKLKRYSVYNKNKNHQTIINRHFTEAYPSDIFETYQNLYKDGLIKSDLKLKLEIQLENIEEIFPYMKYEEYKNKTKAERFGEFAEFKEDFLEGLDLIEDESVREVWRTIHDLKKEQKLTTELDINRQKNFLIANIVYRYQEELPRLFLEFNKSFNKYLDDKNLSLKRKKRLFSEIAITMSTGETNLLLLISEIKRVLSNNISRDHYIILIDEIETGMHLEWSRSLINFLVNYINEINKIGGMNFQLIFTTHSPYMLSDIKPGNVIMLEKNQETGYSEGKVLQNTFAKNIQEIMKENLIDNIYGDFALAKINSMISRLNGEEEQAGDEEELSKEIHLISEPILRNKLLEMYDKKYDTSEFSIEKQLQKLNLNEEQRQQVRAMIEANISSANADK
ncbi:AAA family ATPase [Streptococcus oralis]|uniref:Endonuclease GajA/Old nuclease/RecF-like AAA domain-containing protein n=1 Tax=Streptococcus oralis TaxID=1303 RepID=A0A139PC76_STROR|nr:AAA family ATPase [Streptococcus oralis]KXT85773.1 hypothetical protein SORDD16_01288 [Streptococcus oralis]